MAQGTAYENKTPPAAAPALAYDDSALLSRIAQLERTVAQLRNALRPYYDVDGKGQVG